jgi:hypothetical protein
MPRSSTFLTNLRYTRRQILGGLSKGALIGVAATKSLSFAYPDTAIAAEIGPPQVFDFLARVTNAALNCAWYQKWSVHRRTRPEEFGGLVHNHLTGAAHNPIHSQVLTSRAVERFLIASVLIYFRLPSRKGAQLIPPIPPDTERLRELA